MMISEKEWLDVGYTILPCGGWMSITPELLGNQWVAMAMSLGFDPHCKEVILGLTAFKQIDNGEEE
jgi:hypothetical protein